MLLVQVHVGAPGTEYEQQILLLIYSCVAYCALVSLKKLLTPEDL